MTQLIYKPLPNRQYWTVTYTHEPNTRIKKTRDTTRSCLQKKKKNLFHIMFSLPDDKTSPSLSLLSIATKGKATKYAASAARGHGPRVGDAVHVLVAGRWGSGKASIGSIGRARSAVGLSIVAGLLV